jgi:hypothetical protein
MLISAAVEKRVSDSQHDNPCLRRIKNVEETSTDGRGVPTRIKSIKKYKFNSWISEEIEFNSWDIRNDYEIEIGI